MNSQSKWRENVKLHFINHIKVKQDGILKPQMCDFSIAWKVNTIKSACQSLINYLFKS